MPQRPLHPCAVPGCPATLRVGSRCPEHRAQRHRAIDERRGSSSARGYGATWQRVRRAVLAREPLCRFHDERGETVAATDVDHIDGNSRNNHPENLRPLCHACHSARTMRDQGPNARRAR